MVVLPLYFVLIFALRTDANIEIVDRERQKDCDQKSSQENSKWNCERLKGDFIFYNGMPCQNKYREAVALEGRLVFRDMSIEDPMDCFPKLNLILTDNNDLQNPAILVESTVKGMKRFSFHPSLTIDSQAQIWIKIEAKDYVMDAESYDHLATRLKDVDRLAIKHGRQGECFITEVIVFMTELDNCELVNGNIELDHNVQSTETVSPVHTIEGCIKIDNTSLEMNDLEFLRNIKRINCDRIDIKNNPKLCLTDGFLDSFLRAHTKIMKKDYAAHKTTLKATNGKFCDTVCFSKDLLQETKVCKEIQGDLVLRATLKTKLSAMETLKGRLIVEGFSVDELFSVMPKLKKIISTSDEPAVYIARNVDMKRITFPKNLTIVSKAKKLIVIADNSFYKMDKKQADRLYNEYGKNKVQIDVLDEKECYFPNEVKNITDLDECEYIVGNLILRGDVGNSSAAKLRIISGCIRIEGTNLTDLDFLLYLDELSGQQCVYGHAVINNVDLCAQDWIGIFATINGGNGMRRMAYFNNKDLCFTDCDREELYLGPQCNILKESLVMPLDYSEELLPSLVNLEEIHGPLRVISTDANKLDTLISLSTIELENDEPAIEIRDNENLTYVDLSHLENIRSPGNSSKMIIIRNNGNYTMPYKQYKRLVKKWGKSRVNVDHEEKPKDFEDDDDDDEEEDVEEEPGESGLAVGVIAGVSIGVLVILFAGIAILAVKYRKTLYQKREIKEEETSPLLNDAKHDAGEKTQAIFNQAQNEKSRVMSVKNPSVILKPQDAEKHSLMKSAISATSIVDKTQSITGAIPVIPSGLISNNQTSKGTNSAITALTAKVGVKAADGDLKDNVSVMKKESKIDNKKQTSSKTNKAVSAISANVGGKGFQGNLKENESVMKREEKENKTQSVNMPVSAMTAMVGGKSFAGHLKNNESVMKTKETEDNNKSKMAVSAMTAKIGEKGFVGHTKDNESVMKNKGKENESKSEMAVSAMTANIGGKTYSGNTKSNVSVMGKSKMDAGKKESNPVSAITANIGGKFSGNAKNNASVMQKTSQLKTD